MNNNENIYIYKENDCKREIEQKKINYCNDLAYLIDKKHRIFCLTNSIQNILDKYSNLYDLLINIIYDDVYIAKDVLMGKNDIIKSYTNISSGVKLNNNIYVEKYANIAHNCTIGDNCFIGIGVSIAGGCTIGNNVILNAGTIVKENITIGNNVIIEIGSVVLKDIPDNCYVVGNPCRIKKMF